MSAQAGQVAFAHTTQFHSAPAEKLAARLLALAPANFRNGGRVYFTSGGSEATETAIKLARQFHLESGQPSRYRVLSRRQSYHGSTLGAMSVSGNVGRRAPYAPLLSEWGHIAPCFCYHCPFELTYPGCRVACADDLSTVLNATDPATAAAFIFEPVVGATLGAAVPPDGYVERITEICRQQGILLIADEIMTSGYAPLGAVLVSARVAQAFASGTGTFQHGFTYQAHPVSTAAGNAVLDYVQTHKLFERVVPASAQLRASLAPLAEHPHVGDIRGLGLLLGIEFVREQSSRQPFPKELNIAEKIRQAALKRGVLTYPSQGCLDGFRGDHLLLAPPFIITAQESAQIADALAFALAETFPSWLALHCFHSYLQ